jgi:hypothetical protein
MKYIMLVWKNGGTYRYIPIIFPNMFPHSDMAAMIMQHEIFKKENTSIELISAGDYNTIDGSCSGHSTTLGLKSRNAEDTKIISIYMYCHGIVYQMVDDFLSKETVPDEPTSLTS